MRIQSSTCAVLRPGSGRLARNGPQARWPARNTFLRPPMRIQSSTCAVLRLGSGRFARNDRRLVGLLATHSFARPCRSKAPPLPCYGLVLAGLRAMDRRLVGLLATHSFARPCRSKAPPVPCYGLVPILRGILVDSTCFTQFSHLTRSFHLVVNSTPGKDCPLVLEPNTVQSSLRNVETVSVGARHDS